MTDEEAIHAIIRSVSSMLGPFPALKVVDGAVTSDAFEVLDAHAESAHPVNALLSSVVAGFRRATVSGSTTCVLLCSFLALEVLRLSQETRESNVSISHGISLAAALCMEVLEGPEAEAVRLPDPPTAERDCRDTAEVQRDEETEDDLGWFFDEPEPG